MKIKIIVSFIAMGSILQGCSFFNTVNCNNKQVIQAVEKLYASQVDISPLSSLDKIQQQFNPNYQQTKLVTQSTLGINLTQIKELNPEQIKSNKSTEEAEGMVSVILEQFQGAQYICEGIIQQDIESSVLSKLTEQFSKQDLSLVKDNKLRIPVFYAVHQQDGDEQFQVQYSPKNPMHLMLAIMLKSGSKEKSSSTP